MSKNENVLKDKEGNVVCYLREPKNGGIDLYDEYNKGIDKIVCKFMECADKLRKAEKAKEDKEEALERNERDKRDKISVLTAERRDKEQQINDAEAEQKQKISDREREYEDKKRELEREWPDKQNHLKQLTLEEKDSAVKAYAACIAEKRNREFHIENAYDMAILDLSDTSSRLVNEIFDCETRSLQIRGDVSKLEEERGHIFSDAEIQSEVDSYEKDPTSYNAAWDKYYQRYGNGQAFEEERKLKEKIERISEDPQSEIGRRTNARLEKEKLLTVLREKLIRDEEEIERCSKNHARNVILGITKNTAENHQGKWKHIAMLLFCYPKEILWGRNNRQLDWIALIPALLFMAAAYLHKPTLWSCIYGWLAVLLVCFIRKSKTSSVSYRGWPILLVVLLFYPVYIFLLMQSIGLCGFIMLLCLLMYFGNDIKFKVKMCNAKNRERYQEAYEGMKAFYHDQIVLAGEAERKQQQYLLEEEVYVQAELQQMRSSLEQLSLENQRELERLQKAFQAEGWPLEVETRKKTLLNERTEMQKWNEQINQMISDKNSELQREEDIRESLTVRYNELKEKWLPQLQTEREKFLGLCKQRLDEEINKLKAHIRTPDLRDRYGAYGEAEMEQEMLDVNIIAESGVASYMTRLPAYEELRISRIDWYQVTLKELPDMLGQAEKELGDWAEKLQHDVEAKEQECAEALAAADASAEAKMRTVQDEYDKKKAETDKAFAADKEKIESEYRRRIVGWSAEKEEIDSNIQKQEKHYQERGEELRIEWDKKIKDLNDEYRKEMNIRLEQLEKNGMADVCGFNYQQAWMHFHALATNTMGFPTNLDMYNNDIFVGLTAKVFGVNHEHCEFLPKHFMWGYYPVEEEGLLPEIAEEIANSLGKSGQMQIPSGWDAGDDEYYHIEKPPIDTFYKLNHTPMKDGPAMIIYDLGDLDEDTQKRNLLMDFILRTFVFSAWQCVGNADHLRFHVISMQYEEYLSSYHDGGFLTEDKKLQIYSDKSGVRKVIEELRKSRDALKLNTNETLFSRNCERSKNGRNPSADYEVLVIVNTEYSGLEDTGLRSLLQASARKEMGMYSYLLVDVDMLRRNDNSARERTVGAIQTFANDIGSDDRFYELDFDGNASDDGTKFQIKQSNKNAVIAAIENSIAGGA